MQVKPLLPDQPVTAKGDLPSLGLVEIIQRLTRQIDTQTTAIADLTARLDGIAAVTAPSGGLTIDTQARTAISAIIAAA